MQQKQQWKWPRGVLLVALLFHSAAHAELDTFGLGTGRDGPLVVEEGASGFISSYAQVSAPIAPGDNEIAITTFPGYFAFNPGGLIMVLQTTGLAPEPPSGTPGPIDLTNDAVGHWELARIASMTSDRMMLTEPLLHAYPAGVTQVIHVPEFTDVTLMPGATLQPGEWNGRIGGVLAFLATGTVTNHGQISASSLGFFGANYLLEADPSGTFGCTGLDEPPPTGSIKGEGITARFRMLPPPFATGRGNTANGGGGGVCVQSGGGGGGNSGAGGIGGYSTVADGSRNVGGMGGAALTYSPRTRLVPGGGGGAGAGNALYVGGAGARGGGIVFIRARQLAGTGTIVANGAGAFSGIESSGGGGGAGGTISLRLGGSATCGSISARGGAGGSPGVFRAGPGGGGGGGRVLFQSTSPGTCPIHVTGGSAGTQQDLAEPTYGAQPGGNGSTEVLSSAYAPPTVTVTSPAQDSVLPSRRPTLPGTATPGASVSLVLNGVELGPVTANAAGLYALTLGFDLSENTSYLLRARAELQEVSSTTVVSTFTVDALPPETLIVSGPPAQSASTSATFDFDSNESPVTYSCSLDGGPFIACADPQAVMGLADGEHMLHVRARDSAGNVDPTPAAHAWRVNTASDTTPPETLIRTRPPTRTNSASATFDFDSTESPVTYECSLDGAAFTPCDASVSFTVTDGSHTLQVRATDGAGNSDPTPASYTWIVDALAPSPPAVATPVTNAVLDTPQPTVSGTAEPGSIIVVSIDSVPTDLTFTDAAGNWALTSPPLLDGPHMVQTTATDAAGNTSTASSPRHFIVDTLAPTTAIVSAPPRQTAEPSATFDFSSSESPVTYECSLDGSAFEACSPPVTFTVTSGNHLLRVRARDSANNVDSTPAEHAWTVGTTNDATPPETTINFGPPASTAETSATFDFSSNEEAVTYECSLDGAAFTACSDPWTLTGLPAGAHTLQVRALDVAGNQDPTPASHSWQIQAGGDSGGEGNENEGSGGCSAASGNRPSLVLLGWVVLMALVLRRSASLRMGSK